MGPIWSLIGDSAYGSEDVDIARRGVVAIDTRNNRLKIVIVNRHVTRTTGGSEIQCDIIGEGLQNNGHSVTYVAPIKANESSDDVNTANYNLKFTKLNASAISAAITNERPDVVYWRYNKRKFYHVAKRLRAERIPIVFAISHINDVLPWGGGAWRHRSWLLGIGDRIRSRINHKGFKYVSYVTSLNNDLLRYVNCPRKEWVPNAMANDVEPFEWPRPYCLWVANLKPAKRPELYMRLAKELEGKSVDFLMVGHLQSEKYRWIQRNAISTSNFRYLGSLSPAQVNGALQRAKLHIHTCAPEGYGNIFIQAWQQGVPSVSLGYDPGGHIAENGIGLSAGDDWALFVDQVDYLLREDDVRFEMAQRAKCFAEQTFSERKMVSRIESILLTVRSSYSGGATKRSGDGGV